MKNTTSTKTYGILSPWKQMLSIFSRFTRTSVQSNIGLLLPLFLLLGSNNPLNINEKKNVVEPPSKVGVEKTLPIVGSGDYSIDYSAHDPMNYNRFFPNQISPPSMRNIGPDPLGGANHSGSVESLAPEALALGQIVAFDFYITVDNPPQCNATQGDCITIVAE